MKNIVIIYFLGFLFLGLSQDIIGQDDQGKIEIVNPEDSVEYEIIILDVKFDSYLISIAKPMEFYSIEHYKSWNTMYVKTWNARHSNPIRFGDFYDSHIDYDPFTDYGLELNYKLYNYFKFIEYEYKIDLNVR